MLMSVYTLGVVALGLIIKGVVPCALFCILQYFLSKQENPWLGRILPILTGTVSALIFLFLALNVVAGNDTARVFLMLFALLLVMNIPTAVFMLIYHFTRKKFVDKRDMDRMNIQDLE